MKHTYILIACSLIFCLNLSAASYYLDSRHGDDSRDGNSEQTAWKTLEGLNALVLKPGDKVFLKRGSQFEGQLHLRGAGSKKKPVVITSYGDGNKPLIQGHGEKEYTLLLDNMEYVTVSNLELTNTGATRMAKRRGLIIRAINSGDLNQICIDGLTIRDVNGSLTKSEGGGSAILWENGGTIPSRFVGLTIENCHLLRCERNGINAKGNSGRDNWYPSLQVVIRGNLLEGIPGDGIVPIGCDGALIEKNIMRDCPDILSHKEAAAGIWPWSSDNTIIQYNEVSGHNAKWDGQGFDADYNCRNTLIQYNYSHDNAGGFLLICNDGKSLGKKFNMGTENTVIRYNISVNDGLRAYPTKQKGWFSPVIHITGPTHDTKIHNNIIYVRTKEKKEIDRTIIAFDNWGGKFPIDTYIADNIFYVEDSASFDSAGSETHTFVRNIYCGAIDNLPDDERAILADPGFVGAITSHDKATVMKNLKIGRKSPCTDRNMTSLAKHLLQNIPVLSAADF